MSMCHRVPVYIEESLRRTCEMNSDPGRIELTGLSFVRYFAANVVPVVLVGILLFSMVALVVLRGVESLWLVVLTIAFVAFEIHILRDLLRMATERRFKTSKSMIEESTVQQRLEEVVSSFDGTVLGESWGCFVARAKDRGHGLLIIARHRSGTLSIAILADFGELCPPRSGKLRQRIFRRLHELGILIDGVPLNEIASSA